MRAMERARPWWIGGACILLASCTTVPYPPLGPTQELAVRTDPAAATCTVLQDGVLVAAIEATPGTATVRRDFCPTPFFVGSTSDYCTHHLERLMPIEVICRKDGYLDLRRTFTVVDRATVQSEEGPESAPSAGSEAAGGLVVLGTALPPLGILVLPPTALVMTAERIGQPPNYAYAYRSLPTFFLIPASFISESERDAFFGSLKTKLEAERDAKRAYIDKQCRYFPCKASDANPCRDPVCERRRADADAQLKSQLDEISALRAQVPIRAP